MHDLDLDLDSRLIVIEFTRAFFISPNVQLSIIGSKKNLLGARRST